MQTSDDLLVVKMMTGRRPHLRQFIWLMALSAAIILKIWKVYSSSMVSSTIKKIRSDTFSELWLEAETTNALMSDYELPTSDSNSQDYNLNRFMQFCGVRYQLVEWNNYVSSFVRDWFYRVCSGPPLVLALARPVNWEVRQSNLTCMNFLYFAITWMFIWAFSNWIYQEYKYDHGLNI